MPRSGDNARRRLQQAALELYRERGYDQTTTAEIAARAGVTERTFFRHFPDKREVLFDGEAVLRAALDDGLAAAPAGLGPVAALFRAFRSVGPLIEGNRAFSEPRREVIAATPALHERELSKHAALVQGLADALRRRGVEEGAASLAAQVGMAAFGQATHAWLDDPGDGLDAHLDRALAQLRALSPPG